MKKAEVQMVLHRQAGSHNILIAISCGVSFNKYLSLSPSFTDREDQYTHLHGWKNK